MQLTKQKTQVQQQEESLKWVELAAAYGRMFFLKMRNKLAHQWAMLVDYVSPAVEEAEEIELEWIASGAISVLYVIDGDDPYEAFCQMEPAVRLEALRRISETYCRTLKIPVYPLELTGSLSATTMGAYRDLTKVILINERLVDEQPITVETAKEAILTVIHETFHAYQYVAAYSPKKYHLSPMVAARWRENARNYCGVQQNPHQYWLQVLEVYARYVEEGVHEVLMDKQQVEQICRTINEITGEGE